MALKSALKVLVVDDQRTSRMLIRDALDQIGITQVSFAVAAIVPVVYSATKM